MISAYESIDLVDQCILSGADAYLLKPLRMHELRNIWQYVWRRRHEAVLQQHVSEELMSARRAAEYAAAHHFSHETTMLFRKQALQVMDDHSCAFIGVGAMTSNFGSAKSLDGS